MMQSADHATGRMLWEIEEVARRLSAARTQHVVSVYGHNFATCGPQVFFILDDTLTPMSGAIVDQCFYRTGFFLCMLPANSFWIQIYVNGSFNLFAVLVSAGHQAPGINIAWFRWRSVPRSGICLMLWSRWALTNWACVLLTVRVAVPCSIFSNQVCCCVAWEPWIELVTQHGLAILRITFNIICCLMDQLFWLRLALIFDCCTEIQHYVFSIIAHLRLLFVNSSGSVPSFRFQPTSLIHWTQDHTHTTPHLEMIVKQIC